MPIIGEPGTIVMPKPDVWDVDGFSFHNQISPVDVTYNGEGAPTQVVRAYAVVEVVAGVAQKDGSMAETGRQAVRIEGKAFMDATARYPGLYILVAQTLYEELQRLGHVPSGDIPMSDDERKAVIEYAKQIMSQYGG